MGDELARYRRWYRVLLNFYPKSYRERFAEGMAQTFNDLCRERIRAGGKGFSAFVFWIFAETFAAAVRERATNLVRWAVPKDDIQMLRIVKYSAVALGCLTVAGIVTLMVLARGKDEDIAGVVAPALLLTLLSAIAAVVAGVVQSGRERRRRNAGE